MSMAEANHVLHISMVLVWAGLRLKHAGFAEEKEWGDSSATAAPTFSVTRNFAVAHSVSLPTWLCLYQRSGELLPQGIAEVIVGPSSNAQAIVASIELLRYTLSRVVT